MHKKRLKQAALLRKSSCEALPRQGVISYVAAFAALLVFIVVFLDAPLQVFFDDIDPNIYVFMKFVTEIGNSAWPLGAGLLLLALVSLRLLWAKGYSKLALMRLRACLFFFLWSVAGSGIIASLLKNIIGRGRPSNSSIDSVLDFMPFAFQFQWASFPSGHATTSIAVAIALSLIFPRYALGFLSFGLCGALSRVVLGVHWTSDIIAGAVLGTTFTILSAQFFIRRLTKHHMGIFRFTRILPPKVISRALK